MGQTELIHLRDVSRGFNVYCSNGSAHAKRTTNRAYVTCPICMERAKISNERDEMIEQHKRDVRFWRRN